MLRRIAVCLGLAVAVSLVGIPLWVAAHRTDLEAPHDSDLEVPAPDDGDLENGLASFDRAAVRLQISKEDDERVRAMLRGEEPRDPAWVTELVRRNRGAYRELERAITAPAIVFPDALEMVESDASSSLLRAQMLVRLASLDARVRLARGDTEGALTQSLLGLRVGAALGRARRPVLISAMIALSVENIGLRALVDVVRSARFEVDSARALYHELETSRLTPESWRLVLAGEYQFVKATTGEYADQSVFAMVDDQEKLPTRLLRLLPDDFLWQPNRTLDGFARVYRGFSASYSAPCRRDDPAFLPAGRPGYSSLLSGNGIGDLLLAVTPPNFSTFNTRRCHTESRLALVKTLAAGSAYHLAEGDWPESLDVLVPKYLDRVPVDPFGGAPLRFDRSRLLLYSVGSDLDAGNGEGPPSIDDELAPATYLGQI